MVDWSSYLRNHQQIDHPRLVEMDWSSYLNNHNVGHPQLHVLWWTEVPTSATASRLATLSCALVDWSSYLSNRQQIDHPLLRFGGLKFLPQQPSADFLATLSCALVDWSSYLSNRQQIGHPQLWCTKLKFLLQQPPADWPPSTALWWTEVPISTISSRLATPCCSLMDWIFYLNDQQQIGHPSLLFGGRKFGTEV